MMTTNGLKSLARLHLDLVANQTFDNVSVMINSAGVAFDAVHGLGQASNTSSAVLAHMGGFDAQQITAIMNYPSPTTTGTESMGVVLGCLEIQTGATANYLYAGVNTGNARIVTEIGGAGFVTLTSTAWAVAQGVDFTIQFSRVGRLLTAVFTASSGPSPVTLTSTLPSNSTLLQGGLMGFKSTSKAIWCKDLIVEQLA